MTCNLNQIPFRHLFDPVNQSSFYIQTMLFDSVVAKYVYIYIYPLILYLLLSSNGKGRNNVNLTSKQSKPNLPNRRQKPIHTYFDSKLIVFQRKPKPNSQGKTKGKLRKIPLVLTSVDIFLCLVLSI